MGRFQASDGRAWGPHDRRPRRPRPRRAGRTILVLAGVVAAIAATGGLVLGAAPAGAHAVLEATEPTDGAQLDAAPQQVVLRFSESVSAPDDGITVYAGSGDALDIGEPEHPDGAGSAVAVALPDLDEGAYVVSWRVVSADSHPVSGAFTFTVGNVDPADAQALQASLGGGTGGDDTLGVVYGVARFLAFAGLILLVGGAAFVLGVWPDGLGLRRVRALVRTGWAVALVATAACIGLQGAYGQGLSLGDALDPSVVSDELGARAGRMWLVRLVLLVIVAVAVTVFVRRRQEPAAAVAAGDGEAQALDPVGRGTAVTGGTAGITGTAATAGTAGTEVEGAGGEPVEPGGPGEGAVAVGGGPTEPTPGASTVAVAERGGDGTPTGNGGNVLRATGGGGRTSLAEARYIGALLGLGLLATVSFAGHASAGRWLAVALVTDIVHLAAVCIWLGGLAVLTLVVLRRDAAGLDRTGLERVVNRFSEVAFVAVLAIVVSGVVQGWRQLDGLDPLTGTSYGRLLIVKVALVAAMVAAAGISRAWLRGWFLAATDRAAKAAGNEPSADGHRSDLYLLRQSVGIEAVIAIAVLAVTAALVQAAPEEASASDAGGGGGGPVATEVHGANVALDATVDPTTVGPTDIDLQVSFHDGTPLEPEEITAELSLPTRDLGPLDVALEPVGTGHYRSTDAEFPFAGEWELEVTVRTTDIDQDRLTVPVNVG